jgi:hypothetical protein
VSLPAEPETRDFFFHMFTAPEGKCEACGRGLVVSQWRGRHVEGIDGYHMLVMRDRRCPQLACEARKRIFKPAEEHRFAFKKDVFGLDVMFEIAERRLQDDLSFDAIRARLNAKGVPISLTSTCESFKRFVALTSCRSAESEETREKLRKQGGMVVLIDGVQFDDRSPVLYLVLDAISRTPLFAERHAVRSKAGLAPILKRLKAMNVPIKAFVTDMEKGLVPAIREVFPDVPHQFCQLHFLKRCAGALDKPLAALGVEIDRAAEKLRGIRRDLMSAPAPATPAEARERVDAEGLLVAAHAASKRAGRAPSMPTALRRHEELGYVANTAQEIASLHEKGALGCQRSHRP